jgi:hypothetical protein
MITLTAHVQASLSSFLGSRKVEKITLNLQCQVHRAWCSIVSKAAVILLTLQYLAQQAWLSSTGKVAFILRSLHCIVHQARYLIASEVITAEHSLHHHAHLESQSRCYMVPRLSLIRIGNAVYSSELGQ